MQDIQTTTTNPKTNIGVQVGSFFEMQDTQELDARRRLEIAFEKKRLEREMREFALDYDLDV